MSCDADVLSSGAHMRRRRRFESEVAYTLVHYMRTLYTLNKYVEIGTVLIHILNYVLCVVISI